MNASAVLLAVKTESTSNLLSYLGGLFLFLMVVGFAFMAFAGSMLANASEERVPARLRWLRKRLQPFFETEDGRDSTGDYTDEVGERMMLMRQLQLIHPDADPTTIAMMAAQMQRNSQKVRQDPPSPYKPKHAGKVADAVTTPADRTLFVMEVNLYLGFALDVREADYTVHVNAKQYKALKQFCAFRYENIETPEFTFGRFGLLLINDN